MINSVGEYPAGEEVELEDELADRYILRGYAEGTTSREYSSEEIQAHLDDVQTVGL